MITLYHAPLTRSFAILWLLEELGTPYEIALIDIDGEGAPEAYRAIQPHKKVPAIRHGDVVVTERAAIAAYLADALPEAGLAPVTTDGRRGPYLSWLVYHDAVFDPAITARANGLVDYVSDDYSFGLFDDVVANLEKALADHPHINGDAFSAADVLFASAIHFTMTEMTVLPERPAFVDYLARMSVRPAFGRAMRRDIALAQRTDLAPSRED